MPEKKTVERAAKAKREGKSSSTQAGEFVREEMHHMREGQGAAQSPKQAVAIGLSKARKAGVEVKPPKKGSTSEQTRKRAQRDAEEGAQKGAQKGAQAEKAGKKSDQPGGSRARAKTTPTAPRGGGRATASSSSRSKSRAGRAKGRAGKNAQR